VDKLRSSPGPFSLLPTATNKSLFREWTLPTSCFRNSPQTSSYCFPSVGLRECMLPLIVKSFSASYCPQFAPTPPDSRFFGSVSAWKQEDFPSLVPKVYLFLAVQVCKSIDFPSLLDWPETYAFEKLRTCWTFPFFLLERTQAAPRPAHHARV